MASEYLESAASFYEILKVSPRSSDADIKRAYRILAMTYHPDRNPHNRRLAGLRFRLINEAYAQIGDREKRARYDRALRAKRNNAGNDNNAAGVSWLSRFAGFFRAGERK